MDIKTKELIAIGASVVANCQPCLTYHINKARENGAENRDITEAVSVAKMVRKGAIGKMDQFISAMPNITEGDADDVNIDCRGI